MIIIIITRITSKHKRNIPKSRNDHRTEKPKNNFNLKNNSDNNNAYKDGNNSNNNNNPFNNENNNGYIKVSCMDNYVKPTKN